jgi:hypothetical protein
MSDRIMPTLLIAGTVIMAYGSLGTVYADYQASRFFKRHPMLQQVGCSLEDKASFLNIPIDQLIAELRTNSWPEILEIHGKTIKGFNVFVSKLLATNA